jgi:hypothetical protein
MWLLTQIASGICWILYGSFFEWYWHKLWMHTPRPPREAFRGHTIVHHGLYRGDDSYFLPEGEDPEHILLKPYALPAILLAHLPIILLIERYVAAHTAIGAITACILYFSTYEYMHWNMHVPRGHLVERFRWFQFLRQHHKLHHRYMQKNFCVLFPLADWMLGTLITEESLAQRRAQREQAIAGGSALTPRKVKRLRARRSEDRALPLSEKPTLLRRKLARFETGRVRESRKQRKAREAREALEPAQSRSER